jgi:hypothetical protein
LLAPAFHREAFGAHRASNASRCAAEALLLRTDDQRIDEMEAGLRFARELQDAYEGSRQGLPSADPFDGRSILRVIAQRPPDSVRLRCSIPISPYG